MGKNKLSEIDVKIDEDWRGKKNPLLSERDIPRQSTSIHLSSKVKVKVNVKNFVNYDNSSDSLCSKKRTSAERVSIKIFDMHKIIFFFAELVAKLFILDK